MTKLSEYVINGAGLGVLGGVLFLGVADYFDKGVYNWLAYGEMAKTGLLAGGASGFVYWLFSDHQDGKREVKELWQKKERIV